MIRYLIHITPYFKKQLALEEERFFTFNFLKFITSLSIKKCQPNFFSFCKANKKKETNSSLKEKNKYCNNLALIFQKNNISQLLSADHTSY